jgi:Domain of unknown function (DUF4189)
MKTKFFLLLCLLMPSYSAVADNGCAYGESATGPRSQANPLGCVPDPRTLQQPQAQPEQPPAPRGHWETQWGSIAIDSVKGKLGGVINHKSKLAAEKAALKECYSRGSGGNKDCKIYYTYYNQCSAVAWGDSKYTGSGRATIEEASQDAMQGCSEATTNCVVVYNACSNAKWISY